MQTRDAVLCVIDRIIGPLSRGRFGWFLGWLQGVRRLRDAGSDQEDDRS